MRYLIPFGALLALISCGSDPVPAPTVTPTSSMLRIVNTSAHDLKDLTVIFPTQRITFGTIPAGATSKYVSVSHGVYQYSAFSVDINGRHFDQGVTDWIGERPMAGYKFSYVIDADISDPDFVLALEKVVREP